MFKTVSVADFRKNLQAYIKGLPDAGILLARHSDVVAVILDLQTYNLMTMKIAELEGKIAKLENSSPQ